MNFTTNKTAKVRTIMRPYWGILFVILVFLFASLYTGIVLVFWLFSIRDNLRKPNRVWRRAHQILAIVLLSCVPISYILPKPFAEYRKLMNRSPRYYQQSLENERLKEEGTEGEGKL